MGEGGKEGSPVISVAGRRLAQLLRRRIGIARDGLRKRESYMKASSNIKGGKGEGGEA